MRALSKSGSVRMEMPTPRNLKTPSPTTAYPLCVFAAVMEEVGGGDIVDT